jgi:hypothetical protein
MIYELTTNGKKKPMTEIQRPDTILSSPIRTRSGWTINGTRLGLVLTTGIPLLLTFLVPINRLFLFECPFLNITTLPGPFCGFTRSIWAISAGNWIYTTVNCPLAWLLYATLVGVFVWNAGWILFGNNITNKRILSPTRVQTNRMAVIVIALILLNWIYRLSLGLV